MQNNLVNLTHRLVINKNKENRKYKGLYEGHLTAVVKYAKILSNHYRTDPALAEIAAVSHDIGKFVSNDNHAEIGARFMKAWLESKGMPVSDIVIVCNAIKWHGGLTNSENFNKMSKENRLLSKIIMSADALAHLELAHELLAKYHEKTGDEKAAINKLLKKLEKERNYKITLDYARKISLERFIELTRTLHVNLDCIK